MIQVGAFPKEDEAKERLREAQSVGKTVVAKAEPFTERVTKGTTELLPRPLCRLQPGRRRSGLQVLQAKRDRLHGDQELTTNSSYQLIGAPGTLPGAFCFGRP